MPTKRYALEPNQPKRVEVAWGAAFRNGSVRVDGVELARFSGQKELKQGRDVQLPDGSILRVHLAGTPLTKEVQVLRNGVPLPGSPSDPSERLRSSSNVLFFLGGLNIILGLLAVFAQAGFLLSIGFGPASAAEGVALLVLGFFVRRRSSVAVALAVALLGLDLVASLVTMAAAGGALVGSLFVRGMLLFWVARGFSAARALKRAERAPESATPRPAI